ncbi:MAG: D-glycero-beta-D-manno-heptose 1-phosphate adenylyltransferase, partial [Campylobacter sp.]|nr:D-glycero-beta-D-manno-heptose 1-phosphate adenylyltransferase [Campylobacter sp.]
SWGEIENLKSKKIGFERKIVKLDELLKVDRSGKTLVFTNGCFDIMHIGHISYLQKAKMLGDILVVGLNSDNSVRELKGKDRPVNVQYDRAAMLCAMEFVDFVVIFDELTPHELIKAIKPDILVKGADYKDKEVVGSEFAKRVELIEFIEGKSTTKIIEKIKK